MDIEIMEEGGYWPAMYGLSLSYNRPMEEMPPVAERLYNKEGGGHNKFLESMIVWLRVRAPRHLWQEFDTYRVGVSKQSESTMHKGTKAPLEQADFEHEIPKATLMTLNLLIERQDFDGLTNQRPEGYLQTRQICTNYKTLRYIIGQRRRHKKQQWRVFCETIIKGVKHPEFFKDFANDSPR